MADRLYPFRELTDGMRAQIDLKDGSVEDWEEILGEPTLTPLDFSTSPSSREYDPSSYDFRIWVAWHDATDHLFVAAEMVDDFHAVHEHRNNPLLFGDASVTFYVDGDNSGGGLRDPEGHDAEKPYDMVQAQEYYAFARTYDDHSNVALSEVSYNLADWMHREPYADGGGGIVDSQPIHAVVEFYVTPFDRFIWDDPEQSVISDLFVDKIIRFAFGMETDPEGQGETFGWHGLFGPDASCDLAFEELFWESDLWAREILLGSDIHSDDTGAGRASWDRIKASLPE